MIRRHDWTPEERKAIHALWATRPNWTLKDFVAEHNRRTGVDRSPGSVWVVIREYVRDGLLPGNHKALNKEIYQLNTANHLHARFIPPAARERGRSYEAAAERSDWLHKTLAMFPQGIRAAELRQLAIEAGYSWNQVYYSMIRRDAAVVRESAGPRGAARFRLAGRDDRADDKKAPAPGKAPNGTSPAPADAKILEAYRSGAISIDQALALLRGK